MPKCPVCGKPIECECMLDDGTLVHPDCFHEYMDRTYGKNKWRECENDGLDGYYEFTNDGNAWFGTGIFYTEYEPEALAEMDEE